MIPDAVTEIGRYAFAADSNLRYLVLGKGVKTIEEGVFNNTGLTAVYYKGTQTEWNGISIDDYNDPIKNISRYYYSDSQPSTSGDYWHFDQDGKTPVIWASTKELLG